MRGGWSKPPRPELRNGGGSGFCGGYDLVVAAGAMDSPLLAPLWSLLRSDRFQAAVTELGGYSTKEMGRRIR